MFLGESGVGLLAKSLFWGGDSITLGTLVRDIGEPMIPLDRARRVVLGTSLEQLEHVARRIRDEITGIHV